MSTKKGEIEFFMVEAICPHCKETIELEQKEVKAEVIICSDCNKEFNIDLDD